jgi:alpha-soluble NSF attachment protein
MILVLVKNLVQMKIELHYLLSSFMIIIGKMEHYEKAEKKLNSWWPSSTRSEEAAELFEKAANSYKIVKEWDNAGESFVRAADCMMKTSPWESAIFLTNAGNCYKKCFPMKARDAFKEASGIYLDEGKFIQAAKMLREIADIYEKEIMINEAIDSYKEAAEIFENENAISDANACLLLAADRMAFKVVGRYEDAMLLYEKIADRSIDSNLLKWKVKDHLFRAALCMFALGDVVGSKRTLDKYEERDAGFASSREGKFLRLLLRALESYNAEEFTNAVVEFDSISPLDAWKTEILLVIKKTIPTNDQNETDEVPSLV